MTVKIEDICEGDEVLVRAKVKATYPAGALVILDGVPFSIEHNLIAQHIPRKIEVGDRVRYLGREYEVVAGPRTASCGSEQVSLWSDNIGFTWSYLSNLERVP